MITSHYICFSADYWLLIRPGSTAGDTDGDILILFHRNHVTHYRRCHVTVWRLRTGSGFFQSQKKGTTVTTLTLWASVFSLAELHLLSVTEPEHNQIQVSGPRVDPPCDPGASRWPSLWPRGLALTLPVTPGPRVDPLCDPGASRWPSLWPRGLEVTLSVTPGPRVDPPCDPGASRWPSLWPRGLALTLPVTPGPRGDPLCDPRASRWPTLLRVSGDAGNLLLCEVGSVDRGRPVYWRRHSQRVSPTFVTRNNDQIIKTPQTVDYVTVNVFLSCSKNPPQNVYALYNQVGINCFIAAAIYVAVGAVSLCQVRLNKRQEYMVT